MDGKVSIQMIHWPAELLTRTKDEMIHLLIPKSFTIILNSDDFIIQFSTMSYDFSITIHMKSPKQVCGKLNGESQIIEGVTVLPPHPRLGP